MHRHFSSYLTRTALSLCALVLLSTKCFALTWTVRNAGTFLDLTDVSYNGSMFLACSNFGGGVKSSDGITWTSSNVPAAESVEGANGVFLGLGVSGIWRSTDGHTATYTYDRIANITTDNFVPLAAAYGNGVWVVVGSGLNTGSVKLSTNNGLNWSYPFMPTSSAFNSVIFSGGQFYAIADTNYSSYGTLVTSSNGADWTIMRTGIPINGALGRFGTNFFSVQSYKRGWSTNNMQTWTNDNFAVSGIIRFNWNSRRCVASATQGRAWLSTNGIGWTAEYTGVLKDLWGVVHGRGKWVMVGDDGGIVTAEDGDLPVISNISDQTTQEDVPTAPIPFVVSDAETAADALIISLASSNTALIPVSGITIGGSGSSRTLILRPVADMSGTSQITVSVNDGSTTVMDSFLLTVNAVNDPPAVSDVANQTVNEDASTGTLPFTIEDVESAATGLSLTGTSSNTTLVPHANIVFGGTGANRTVLVTPAPNQSGSATITLTASDGMATGSDTFTLTVTPVNDPPTISDITNQSLPEDSGTGALPLVIGDLETAASSLTLTKGSSNTALVPAANIVLGGSGASRTVTVTPAANQSGTATITVTVSDGMLSTSDTFLLTVNAVNDLPAISNITDKTTNEDTATAAISFTVGDVETSAASLTLSSSSSNQSLVPSANVVFGGSGANRTVMVTPAPNQSGTSTITVTVNDGTVSVSDTFLLTVTPVNDLPSVSDVVNQAVNEDTATAALPFTIGDLETAADALTMTKASSNTTLVPVGNIVFTGTGANRFVTVTPAANQSGTATITVTVNDGTATASDTFLVTVTAVNDPPTISGVADRATNEDTATGSIAFTIGDVETSTSSLTVTRASSNTTLVPLTGVVLGGSAASRTVTITPAANQFGASTITLSVSDGSAIVNSTFVLTVNPVNDPPVISNVGNFSTNEDTATPAITFSISDVETSATDLVLTGGSSNAVLVSVSGLAFGGTGGNRTVVITPALNQSGTSTITLTVSDGTATASDTFVLTVTAVNDAPTITDIADQTLIRNTSSAAISFIIGDVETASTSLTVTRTSSNTALLPLSGVVLGGSGSNRSITLTPASNQIGNSTVTVTVSDGGRTTSDTFIVTVTNLTPLAQWKQTHFAANASNESIAGDYANPDGDLLVNLLEYALGGNPNNPASAPSPLDDALGERISLKFSRVVANTDIAITVQAADSLNGPWTDIARSTAGNTTTALVGGASVVETGTGASRTVQVKDIYTIGDAAHPWRFLRLKVQR